MDRLGDEIRGELARFGPQAGMGDLVEAWPDAVGEAIARNAWPARIARDGTVHVHTADSVWAFELGARAVEIAERLGVPRLRFAPGPLPEATPETDAGPLAGPPQPTAQHRAAAAELVAGMENDELRALVQKAAAASLAKASADRCF
jgi:hypothetical protein